MVMDKYLCVVNSLVFLYMALAWKSDTVLNLVLKMITTVLLIANVVWMLQVSGYIVRGVG